MKKILLLMIIVLFTLTACSSPEGPRAEVRLTFDQYNLDSIMEEFDTVLLVKNIKYKDTMLEKGDQTPDTLYTLKDFEIIHTKSKDTKKRNLLQIGGGIVTKKEFYEKTGNIPKPSKEEENDKIKEYLTYYFEFEENTEYIVFVNQFTDNPDKYYTNAYTVFEKSKLFNSYKNEFTGLKIKLEDIKKALPQ